ncbi:protein CD300H-like isoform X2 [Choloepus didactylus]|uniref:protein CD300H-like isoform X2 n=1 Tax=Choloepus didactylus TaxID=27675 RepID=UPI00189D85DD|nr:protein CD300H-like isoform X2 [Choloepus didactylus]
MTCWEMTLLLLCVPGCCSLSGPSTVTGSVGGSLSIQCRYEEKYKMFKKYWCRQPCFPHWQQNVETRGPEETGRIGQVSITDHPGDLTFTVALENLTAQDAGKYRCGVAIILKEDGLRGLLPESFFQVTVLVSPAPSTENSTRTPGSSLSVAVSTRPSRQRGCPCSWVFLVFSSG